jgi:hypothetical protein
MDNYSWQILANSVWSSTSKHGYPVIVYYISPWRISVSIGIPKWHVLSHQGLQIPIVGSSAVCFNMIRAPDPSVIGEEYCNDCNVVTGTTPDLFFSIDTSYQTLDRVQEDSLKIAEYLFYLDLNYVRAACGLAPVDPYFDDNQGKLCPSPGVSKPAPVSFASVAAGLGAGGGTGADLLE